MPKFYGAIDLAKNELQNAAIQNLGAAPASPVKGQMYFSTTDNTLYYWDGTTWQAVKSGTGGPPTGAAGGDLSGTYPNPTVVKATNGLQIPGVIAGVGGINLTPPATGSGNGIRFNAQGQAGPGPEIYQNTNNGVVCTGTLLVMTGILANAQRIQGVGDPSASTDAANKQYVDAAIQGLSWKQPCRVATTANLAALSGLIAVDGVTVAANDRVLVKNQTTQSANGIYVAASGAWTRATDLDTAAEFPNAAVFVSEGTTQADTMWQQTTNVPITVGTSNIVWTQIGSASSYIGGAGLTLSGNTFDVGAGTGILVAADSVAIDPAVVALKTDFATYSRKYVSALTGTVAYATGEVVTHNLNTRDVSLTVLNGNAAPYQAVEVDWECTTVNTITIRYNPNLGAGYRAVVIG